MSIVRFDTGPKRSMGHVLGGEKKKFLIRDIDGPAMTAAPMESCRFAARRSPWGRFGSAVVACKRLHRTRRRFKHILANSLSRQRSFTKFRADLGSETSRLLGRWHKRCRRLPNTRPTPTALQESIYPRKKCAIWARWRPVPGKNVNKKSKYFGPDGAPSPSNMATL